MPQKKRMLSATHVAGSAIPSDHTTHRRKTPRRRAKSLREMSLRTLAKEMLFIILLLSPTFVSRNGSYLTFVMLFLMALRSPEGAIKALSISVLLVYGNQNFILVASNTAPLRFSLLFVAGARILVELGKQKRSLFGIPYTAALLLFGLVCALLALINNYCLAYSLLRLSAFVYGATILLAANESGTIDHDEISRWFLAWFSLLALSMLVLVLTGSGYATLGYLGAFRGPLSHSQALGAVFGMGVVFLTALILYTQMGLKKWTLGVVIVMLVGIYMSKARTGMLGALISISIMVLLTFAFGKKLRKDKSLGMPPNVLLGIILGMSLAVFLLDVALGGQVSDEATLFAMKRGGDVEFSVDGMYSSRQGNIEISMETFRKHPLIGIGFGTSLLPGFKEQVTLFSGAIEKGFLPSALLEETGLVGAFFFLFFVFTFYRVQIKRKNFIGIAAFTSLLITNLGEFMIFSFSGLGIYGWLLVGAALSIVQDSTDNPNGAIKQRS